MRSAPGELPGSATRRARVGRVPGYSRYIGAGSP